MSYYYTTLWAPLAALSALVPFALWYWWLSEAVADRYRVWLFRLAVLSLFTCWPFALLMTGARLLHLLH